MKIEDLLSRADTAMPNLMPPGSMSLVTAIDPQLGYPRNLIKVLLKLRPAHTLLASHEIRNQLFLMLNNSEASDLAFRFGWRQSEDVYKFLALIRFNRNGELMRLLGYFGLSIPEDVTSEITSISTVVISRYGLFPHQAQALRSVERYLSTEPYRALLHMPTGSGKTRTAMNVVSNYLRGRDKGVVVWLAHSEELCEQAADEFQKAWSALGVRDVPLIRYWGSYDADLMTIDDGIIIAGLKKAYARLRSGDSQIMALRQKNPLIVMDEAHQAIAPTYQIVINQLMRPLSDARLLGLTATPGRTWNNPEEDRRLSEFFASRKVTLKIKGFNNPVDYLINNEYLARPIFTNIESATNVILTADEQQTIQESFEIPSTVLDRLAADQQRNLLIIHHAEQLLKRHRRVILFAASVQQSDLLAAVLSARGTWAASITSKSPNGRSESIAEFKDDSVQSKIICNFGVLTTGFDAPSTSAALIARPTLSLVLYSQMVGRAMRGLAAGGNTSCEILTVVDTRLPGFSSVVDAFANWEDVWSNENE